MKRYYILIVITVIAILTLYFGGNIIKSQIETVDVLVLSEQEVQNSITCSGQLEPSDQKNVYLSEPSVAEEVFVQVGDKVKQGEELIRVKTGEISDTALEAEASSFPSSLSISDFSSMTGLSSEQAAQVYQQYVEKSSRDSSSSIPSSNHEKSRGDGETKTVTAPVSGIVSEINIQGDSITDTSQPVMVISDENQMQVRLSVNESQISMVQVGQKATITGIGFQGEYHGTVESISNIATQAVSTTGQETVVEVIVTIDDAGEDLKAGLSAKCKIVTSQDTGTIVAPYEAVGAEENGQEYVYVYENGKAIKRTISTGKEFASGFEVLSGLQSGDRLILTPDRLHDHASVIIKAEKDVVN